MPNDPSRSRGARSSESDQIHSGQGDRGGARAPAANAEAAARFGLPAITLPRGGGALKGIDETFAVSPVTGTGRVTVPVALSPGRANFGPALALQYDSGGGNGPYGLGWDIGLPTVTRKTQKGLPRYEDAAESDTFILAGAEDLVPALEERDGRWVPEVLSDSAYAVVGAEAHHVFRYRPRTEGSFSRIERWVRDRDGDTHWRTVTKDNHTTVYGRTSAARLFDPRDPRRVFEWLIEESYDDKGNIVAYEYKPEDASGIDPRLPQEKNRLRFGDAFSQRYLKRVRYGNTRPYLAEREAFDESEWRRQNEWLFQVVLDYGDHAGDEPTPDEGQPWPVRGDPFSTFRPCFEVRTYRLCRRILMFHRFPEELGPGSCLVRSTELAYDTADTEVAAQLRGVTQVGYEKGKAPAPWPLVRFAYTQPEVGGEVLVAPDGAALVRAVGSSAAGSPPQVQIMFKLKSHARASDFLDLPLAIAKDGVGQNVSLGVSDTLPGMPIAVCPGPPGTTGSRTALTGSPVGQWRLTLVRADIPPAIARIEDGQVRLDPDLIDDILVLVRYEVTSLA